MTDFEQAYIDLLIKQYWQQEKAPAEIRLQAGTWQKIVDWLQSWHTEFDLETSTGDRQDIIGRIVGINRILPNVFPEPIPKIAFGFDEYENSRGFDDKFEPMADRAPFRNKFERSYTDLQLDDAGFRFFINAKVSKNTGSPYMADDQGLSIQEVINSFFDGLAYALDKQNMELVLYVSPRYNIDRLRAIVRLDLLPKPHGVNWSVVQLEVGKTFGFDDNNDALPWANKFDLETEPGGRFAEKILIDE